MIITRHNYEEYFLLYVDNELSMQERRTVEAFVKENGDLEEELNMLKQSVLRPDKAVVFQNKGQLMKKSSGMQPINELNYAEYFVLYGDDELSIEENDMVEQFVYRHPQYQVEFELIQQARFTPDTTIVFPDKESLYRKEKEVKVIRITWWKMAAAAVVLLFAGAMGWNLFFNGKGEESVQTPEVIVKKTDNPSTIKTDEPKTSTEESSTAPFVATTTDNPVKTVRAAKKSSAPGHVKIDKKEPEDVYVGMKSTKIGNPSNLTPNSNVTLKGTGSIEGTNVAVVSTPKIIDEAKSLTELNDKMNINDKPQASFAVNDDNDLEVLNTSVKKNTSRGLFRKVGRVLGKVTSIGPKENETNDKETKGVRIANIEIALK